jgi:hypothetical protein
MLKVPKFEIFDRSDFQDLWICDFGAKKKLVTFSSVWPLKS